MIEILFWIFFGLVIAIIIGSFVIMLNPNLQGKMLSNQVKSLKYMMDDTPGTTFVSICGSSFVNSRIFFAPL